MPKLQKTTKQIIQAAARADGVELPTIAAALALLEDKPKSEKLSRPLVVSQSEAARLLSVSRFTIYRLTKLGTLKPITLLGCVRYPSEPGNDVIAAARAPVQEGGRA